MSRSRLIILGALAVALGATLVGVRSCVAREADPGRETTALASWLGDEAARVWSDAAGVNPHRRRAPAVLMTFDDTDEAGHPHWYEAEGLAAPGRVVLLVHGLDEPGDIWHDLAPALARAGYATYQLEYPNDQPIADSARDLDAALRRLRQAGAERVDLVCHSMGGLAAREALTRDTLAAPPGRPRIDRLIMVGTPNAGSPLASLRVISEIRERAFRTTEAPDHDARRRQVFDLFADGDGSAARDLTPGSGFLVELNARPAPPGVAVTCIGGRAAPLAGSGAETLLASDRARRVLGPAADQLHAALIGLSSKAGDGVVSLDSALPDWAPDRVIVDANHRSMLRDVDLMTELARLGGRGPASTDPDAAPPPAIPIILDRLARDPHDHHDHHDHLHDPTDPTDPAADP